MSKLDKMVTKDVHEYALAQMFFGAGAGNRRKLIGAVVDERYVNIPGYAERFDTLYAGLNQTKYAELALKERKKIDAGIKAGKNLRALKNGNIRGLSNGVFVLVAGAYVLHATGTDKVIAEEAKKQYGHLKHKVAYWREKSDA